MIDPRDPPERQIEKLNKIVKSLMWRVEQSSEKGGTPYALFQTAINLENEVQARTEALQAALDDLGATHAELSQALEDAEQSRQNLVDALEAMSEGFALFADDTLVICNERFQNLLPDISGQIVRGMSFDDYTTVVSNSDHLQLDEGQTRADWAQFRRQQHGRKHASFIVRLNGDKWIQVSDRRMPKGRAAVLHTDITEMVREQRRHRDKVLDQQARQMRATIDHMSQGLCAFNSENLLITSNSGFVELLSLPFHLGQDGTTLETILSFLEESQVLTDNSLKQTFVPWVNNRQMQRKLQLEIRRVDGLILDASFRKLPDGGFVASFTDVTSERRATDALARAKSTLELRVVERTSALTLVNHQLLKKTREQERTEQDLRDAKEAAEGANLSKTRFLAAASHDLLQPLNAAKLFIANLLETKLDDAQRGIADSLDRSFSSVESILDALLDISRLDASGAEFTLSHFPLSSILEPLRAEFAQIAQRKGIELVVMPTSLSVVSDQRYLYRIVQNLLSNALKYTETGKVIIGCRRSRDSVKIQVIDTGIGIAERDQRRIFEEFQRLAPSQADQGMGLGLSFVERACHQLKHDLSLSSSPGAGSVFAVEIERSHDIARELENRQDGQDVDGAEDLDVLAVLVENDADILSAMTGTLERWGISVIPAKSTEELLALVAEVGVPPDIIIADYHLDGKDTGLRSIASLRRSMGKDIPGILVTADRSKRLQREARKMGTEVLTKPVEPQALRSLVNWRLQ